jgi:hypothetical protein
MSYPNFDIANAIIAAMPHVWHNVNPLIEAGSPTSLTQDECLRIVMSLRPGINGYEAMAVLNETIAQCGWLGRTEGWNENSNVFVWAFGHVEIEKLLRATKAGMTPKDVYNAVPKKGEEDVRSAFVDEINRLIAIGFVRYENGILTMTELWRKWRRVSWPVWSESEPTRYNDTGWPKLSLSAM